VVQRRFDRKAIEDTSCRECCCRKTACLYRVVNSNARDFHLTTTLTASQYNRMLLMLLSKSTYGAPDPPLSQISKDLSPKGLSNIPPALIAGMGSWPPYFGNSSLWLRELRNRRHRWLNLSNSDTGTLIASAVMCGVHFQLLVLPHGNMFFIQKQNQVNQKVL
jgi:hypothetical protein